ncbi:MAG: hypothetical protein WCH05_10720 [Chlorobiaceae bacterium]
MTPQAGSANRNGRASANGGRYSGEDRPVKSHDHNFYAMKFTITEADMCRLTGYSRKQLMNLREGVNQQQGTERYYYDPILKKGRDWERFGRAVLYAPQTERKLRARRQISMSKPNKETTP